MKTSAAPIAIPLGKWTMVAAGAHRVAAALLLTAGPAVPSPVVLDGELVFGQLHIVHVRTIFPIHAVTTEVVVIAEVLFVPGLDHL